MNDIDEIRETQKKSWDKFSPGWKKWDDLTMGFLQPHGDEIIQCLNPKSTDIILDIAAGTGEPGLSIAPLIKEGKIVITDLSEGMLNVAREKANKSGIKNLETKIADACNLPFDDNSFDGVSCRLGFMFFPDMNLAAKEMIRVLKPGGKLATTVWGLPEKNFWITCIMKNIKEYIEMPTPIEGAPGMFRCAQSGLISSMFKEYGLNEVEDYEVNGMIECENPEYFWNFMTEIAAPFVAALEGADNHIIESIKQGVIKDINNKHPQSTSLDTYGYVISGTK